MAFYKKIVSGCILLAAVFSCAEAAIECGDYGVITFPGGGSIVPRHFDEKWDMTGLDARTYRPEVKKSDGSVSFTGAWKVSGGRFSPELAIEMNVLPGGERELRYRVESAAEIPTNSLAVEFLIPFGSIMWTTNFHRKSTKEPIICAMKPRWSG